MKYDVLPLRPAGIKARNVRSLHTLNPHFKRELEEDSLFPRVLWRHPAPVSNGVTAARTAQTTRLPR